MLDDTKKRFQLGLIYLFAAMATLGVLPFVFMRYFNGEPLKAALDLFIVLVAGANAYYAHRSRNVFWPSVVAAVFYSLATVAIIYLNGPQAFFWVFPAFSANFFLLRPTYAVGLNLLLTLFMVPIALQINEPIISIGMLVALLFTGSMTYVFSREANKHQALLQIYATQDALTGLDNRRVMDIEIMRCIDDFTRDKTPATLIIIDLDHFKAVNDTYGHGCGDDLLVRLATLLRRRARKTDRVFRFGGEEFVLLTRNTDRQEALRYAEELRTHVQNNISSPSGPVTASLGCAELKAGESSAQWLKRADDAMYRAKSQGRNRVVVG